MPSQLDGAKTSCASSDLSTSITSGAPSRIAEGTCSLSTISRYSRRDSSTDVSMKCKTSSDTESGSGVSDSSGHSSGGSDQGSRIEPGKCVINSVHFSIALTAAPTLSSA